MYGLLEVGWLKDDFLEKGFGGDDDGPALGTINLRTDIVAELSPGCFG